MNSSDLKQKLKQESFAPSKKMGQNFLSSKPVKMQIIDAANLTNNSYVLEIGPGYGAITEYLINNAKQVVAIELDKRLHAHLQTKFNDTTLHLINDDVLKVDLNQLLTNYNQQFVVVANLPYSISSKIILKLLLTKNIKTSVLMVQKEMAQRISAQVNTKGYNAFSVLVQMYANVKHLFDVPPSAFVPAPKVMSAVIRITNQQTNYAHDINKMAAFLRLCFLARRKKIINNLVPNLTFAKERVLNI